jgi:ABC-type polysaccharide/polyol phosphate export permease
MIFPLKKLRKFNTAWSLAKYSSRRKKNGKWLGALWSFLEPFLLFLILLILRKQLGVDTGNYYPVYLLLGLVGFNFYTQGTRRLMVAATSYSSYIKTFPLSPEVYVHAAFFEILSDFFYQLFIVLGLLIWYSLPVFYFLPFLIVFLMLAIFSLGVGFFLAGIHVYFRDIEIIWSLINRVLFFATPIFYIYSPRMWFCKYNPLTWYLYAFRKLLIEQQFHLTVLMGLLFLSILLFTTGRFFFKLIERKIAEVV